MTPTGSALTARPSLRAAFCQQSARALGLQRHRTRAATLEARSATKVAAAPAFFRFQRQDDGWVTARVETQPDGACAVHVTATKLPADVPCFLHWGMYRASSNKWLHPKAATPPGSESGPSGAMHTPMTAGPDGHSATFTVPGNLLPLYLGCSVYVGGQKPHFLRLKRGLHCTIPMGMSAGDPGALGGRIVSASDDGADFTANFAVVSRSASSVTLRIMRLDDGNNVIRSMDIALDPVTNRTGDVWHVAVPHLTDIDRVAYGWLAAGSEGWSDESRFAPGYVLLDPYADVAVQVTLPAADGGGKTWAGSLAAQAAEFDWGPGSRLATPIDDTFMMEVDVAAFTAFGTRPEHEGKFYGVLDKLEVLQQAGVTAVVLSCPMLRGPGLGVGGQAHLSYFAPDPRFAVNSHPAAASLELKELIRGLHSAGIEVLLQAEYCFTTEGGDTNAVVSSMRGIDAGLYYRPGGLLNLAHPVVRRLVVDSLCHWTGAYQVDGFVLLSAEALVQDQEGVVLDCPPIVQDITNHPMLSSSKVLAYPLSYNLLPRDGRRGFPHAGRLLQHSNAFASDVLGWLASGDPSMISRVAMRLTGSADMFDADPSSTLPGNLTVRRRPAMAINTAKSSIVEATSLEAWCEDVWGRTNVEGVPGVGFDWTVLMRTAVLTTVLAQGTPLLSTADVRTPAMLRDVANAWRVRRRLKAAMQPPMFDSPRSVTWCGVSGFTPPWDGPSNDGDAYLAIMIGASQPSGVYFGINPSQRALDVTLPEPPAGTAWRVLADTSVPSAAVQEVTLSNSHFTVAAKAALVLEAIPAAPFRR